MDEEAEPQRGGVSSWELGGPCPVRFVTPGSSLVSRYSYAYDWFASGWATVPFHCACMGLWPGIPVGVDKLFNGVCGCLLPSLCGSLFGRVLHLCCCMNHSLHISLLGFGTCACFWEHKMVYEVCQSECGYLEQCVWLQTCMPGIVWACANDCMLTRVFIHTSVSGYSCLCKSELWLPPFRMSFWVFPVPRVPVKALCAGVPQKVPLVSTCDGHVVLCTPVITQCTLCLDVWKRYPFSPQQENSLNSFSLLILLLFVAHILVACSYMSIASCSYREFLPSIFFEACKPLWFVNPCEDWQNGTVYMPAGGFGSSLSGASVDTRYHLPEELKWALCTTSCLCSCEAYEYR